MASSRSKPNLVTGAAIRNPDESFIHVSGEFTDLPAKAQLRRAYTNPTTSEKNSFHVVSRVRKIKDCTPVQSPSTSRIMLTNSGSTTAISEKLQQTPGSAHTSPGVSRSNSTQSSMVSTQLLLAQSSPGTLENPPETRTTILDPNYSKIIQQEINGARNTADKRSGQTSLASSQERTRKFYFFKQNPINSPMSELEAFCSACYSLIIPHFVPTTHAIFDESMQPIGVTSKAFNDFKSLKEVPLTEADLKDEMILRSLAETHVASYFFQEDDAHRGNFGRATVKLHDGSTRTAIVRIDFDNSMWTMNYKFKEDSFFSTAYNAQFRNDDVSRFMITERDIRQFPDLTDASPYYWPTINRTMSGLFSDNTFSPEENDLYKNLRRNPTYLYYKFKTFLKIILVGSEIYQALAKMHVRNKFSFNDKQYDSMHHVLYLNLKDRIEKLNTTLCNMQEFITFLKQDGERALQEIMGEINTQNRALAQKLEEKRSSPTEEYNAYKALHIDTSSMQNKFKNWSVNMTATVIEPWEESIYKM